MRLYCGPTRTEKAVAKERRLEQWHPWFAWRPIRIAPTECVWMEWIERKGRHEYSYGGPSWYWDYRVVED